MPQNLTEESARLVLNGMAHDLGNLMTAVLGGVTLAQANLFESPEEVARHLESAAQAAERCREIAQQMMSLLSGGNIRKGESSDVNAVMHECRNHLLLDGQHVLETQVPADLPCVAIGSLQLLQIVLNLILNAIQSMPAGGYVSVKADLQHFGDNENGLPLLAGKYVCIRVTDTGYGIQDKNRLFAPYFTTKTDGHGLGLASIRALVNACGGTIEVESEVGRGSTFSVYLPVVNS